ncbi:MAG: dimethylsulfonioproprionate lyase family protein [Rhodospirillales bacterium]|nr:dimethylsulfonioproprionate lyase family protein [Rhodospirillales bacterium]
MRAPQPAIVDQAAVDWNVWGHTGLADGSGIRWKLLLSGERTDTVGIVTGIAEIPPGVRLPLHHHEPEETYYIVSGRGRIEIGGQTTEVGPGCAVYIPSNAPHAFQCVGVEPLVFVFTFPRDRLDQIVYCADQ